jgi:Alginate export
MQNTKPTKSKLAHALSLAVMTGVSLGVDSVAHADNATDSAAPKPKSYTKAGMNASNAIMDDPLLGNNYEKPAWNLHDAAKLPEWLDIGVEQRTRYESIGSTFKPNQSTGTSASKTITNAPAFTGQKLTTNPVNYNPAPSTPVLGGPGIGGDQAIELQTDLWIQAKFGKFRVATEIMDARDVGGDQTTLVNNNISDTIDFTQVYVDWADKNAWDSNLGVEIKAGRQTMDLGSRRLVARPVFRNTVNSFTGLRTRVLDNEKWQLNTFVTIPVLRLPGNTNASTNNQIIADQTVFDQEAIGTYFSGGILEGYNLIKNINAEVYLYNLDENNSWNNNTTHRRYFTPGLRFYSKPKKGQFDFQAEGIGQYGTKSYAAVGGSLPNAQSNIQQTHEAYSTHLEAGYSFDLPWQPRLFLEYDYASGSKNYLNPNGTDSRFDPLYAASDMDFGPTGIWGAFQRSNINSPGLTLDFAPKNDLSFRLRNRIVWLASAGDCWGGTSCTSGTSPSLAYAGTNKAAPSGDSYVGDQLGLTGRYNYNSSLNFEVGYYHLFKGEFAKTAGVSSTTTACTAANSGVVTAGGACSKTPGGDSDYVFVQSQLRF